MPVQKVCPICKNIFYVKPFRAPKTTCCSKPCRIKNQVGLHCGAENGRWRGGAYKCNGYVWIKADDHPYKNPRGYIKRARIVVEKRLGRFLLPEENVHHINGIKDDDRDENLQVLTNPEHGRLHSSNMTEERKQRLREVATGRVKSEETCRKLSASLTGRIFSESHRRNISLAKQGKMAGEDNPNYRHGGYCK